MLLNRYGNIDYVMDLYWVDGIELINKAYEGRETQKAWDMYLVAYGNMDKSNFKTFEQWYKLPVRTEIEKSVSTADIFEKAEKIKALDKKRR